MVAILLPRILVDSLAQIEGLLYKMPIMNNTVQYSSKLSLYSKYAILIKEDTFEILYEKNANELMYPASLTKIMTTILLIETIPDLRQSFLVMNDVQERVAQENASTANLHVGDYLEAIDLLYGIMLPSGADATFTLIEGLGFREYDFVQLMNSKAKELGMTHTNFENATGLHQEQHVSTVLDIAKLLQYALKNETFKQLFTAPSHIVQENKYHHGYFFESTTFSSLSSSYFDWGEIIGGKTGYTKQSGLNLSTQAVDHNNDTYLLVTAQAGGSLTSEKFNFYDHYKLYAEFLNR